MSTVVFEFMTDALLGTLLVLTITYCWVLNRRIRVLQDSKGELAKLIRHFDESTNKASSSVVALQSTSKRISETIQERVEKANFIADDLAFLIDKANKLADRLEDRMKEARSPARPVVEMPVAASSVRRKQAAPEVSPDFKPQAKAAPVAVTEPGAKTATRGTARETLASLNKKLDATVEDAARDRANATLEAILKRINGGELSPGDADEIAEAVSSASESQFKENGTEALQSANGRAADKPRSRAEQELLDIIKAGSRV